MASPRISHVLLALAIALIASAAAPEAQALRPPVTWLKGEGNYTKAHRSPRSLERIVVHVTEGAFWGSVTWLKNPRAHASSHFIVGRGGKIVQLVHVSDIAWHAGNWRTNVQSVGIEHEGFTYGPNGFTDAQYRNSARLTAWLARRALMPIDRERIIGHAEVPSPNGHGRGGASGHTDPGPHWNWKRYLNLVRSYAGVHTKLSVETALPAGTLAGIVPWRARTRGGVQRVEFVVDGRVRWTDRKAPFAFAGDRGLNTLDLGNGRHVLELRAYGSGTRHDITRRTIVVANSRFRVTTAGARPWTKVRGTVRLRSRVWGAKASRVVFRLDGRRKLVDRRPPFALRWSSKRVRDGKHVLEVVAHSVDGRVASRRIPVVVSNTPLRPAPKANPKPKLTPKPKPPAAPVLRIISQSIADGQSATGLVLWRVEATAATRVEFLIDGALRGTDVAAPYTLGWDASAEAAGPHRLTARAIGRDGKSAEATVTVTVPEPTASGGSATP